MMQRRTALFGLSTLFAGGGVALAVAAAPTDRRFVVILLRGALDGLAAVIPYGDPGLMALRPALALPAPGQPGGMLDLGGMFGLHPAMIQSHALYQANDLLPIHAVAGHYRARSHFEAQDYLESGAGRRLESGWLNRAAAAVTARGGGKAIAVGGTVPLMLRGSPEAANWAPHGFAEPEPSLYQSILALNRTDPLTGPAIAAGLRDRGFGAAVMGGAEKTGARFAFPALATAAGAMLRAADGPRIASLELGGWDTHTNQSGRIAAPLTQLDQGLGALKTALAEAWPHTVVLVMTEFGRTVRMNGTGGTDHGTATVAFLAGGAVMGGRVAGTWPGLGQGQLFEDRDLAPTTDIRSVAKGVLSAHLGLSPAALRTVFPDGGQAGIMRGLLRG